LQFRSGSPAITPVVSFHFGRSLAIESRAPLSFPCRPGPLFRHWFPTCNSSALFFPFPPCPFPGPGCPVAPWVTLPPPPPLAAVVFSPSPPLASLGSALSFVLPSCVGPPQPRYGRPPNYAGGPSSGAPVPSCDILSLFPQGPSAAKLLLPGFLGRPPGPWFFWFPVRFGSLKASCLLSAHFLRLAPGSFYFFPLDGDANRLNGAPLRAYPAPQSCTKPLPISLAGRCHPTCWFQFIFLLILSSASLLSLGAEFLCCDLSFNFIRFGA